MKSYIETCRKIDFTFPLAELNRSSHDSSVNKLTENAV